MEKVSIAVCLLSVIGIIGIIVVSSFREFADEEDETAAFQCYQCVYFDQVFAPANHPVFSNRLCRTVPENDVAEKCDHFLQTPANLTTIKRNFTCGKIVINGPNRDVNTSILIRTCLPPTEPPEKDSNCTGTLEELSNQTTTWARVLKVYLGVYKVNATISTTVYQCTGSKCNKAVNHSTEGHHFVLAVGSVLLTMFWRYRV